MEQFVDLHIHTNCSDGLFSPAEIIDKVRSSKVMAFAITDHDTLEGYKVVRQLLKSGDPQLISGVELSTSIDGADLHILAYGFDPDNLTLLSALTRFQETRLQRGRKIVEKLNELGVKIIFDDVLKRAGSGVIGRPHIAEAIFDSGAINRYNDAFEKYIGMGKPAYVPKANFSPEEAIALVHKAGGVAVLAHPGVAGAFTHIESLVGIGLDGLEVYHPEHTAEDTRKFRKMAEEFGMSITGGSDFHGREGRNSKIGSQNVSYIYLSHLLQKVKAYQ